MNQSRLESAIETAFNIVIGFSINYALNLFLIPLFVTDGHGHPGHLSAIANWWMGCTYTVVSIVRSYGLRRWFNAGLQRRSQQLAAFFAILFTPKAHA